MIRPATETDADAILRLRALFYQDQVERGLTDTYRDVAAFHRRTTMAAIAGAHSRLFVPEREGALVGYCYLLYKVSPLLDRPSVWSIEEFFIEPSSRASGLADRLLDEAIAGLGAGADARIQLRVLTANDHAHRFWRRHGFETTLSTYELKNTDDDAHV